MPPRAKNNRISAAPTPKAGAVSVPLETLYRRHWAELCRYIGRVYGAGPPSPEDVAQQAFMRLVASGTTTDIHSPKAFLFRSARNVVIDEHRKAATQRGLIAGLAETDKIVSDDLHPERVLTAKERLAVVSATIEAMRPERRRSFLLHRLRHLSFVEIARQTGYSEAGVKKHVAQALDEIERAVAAAESEQPVRQS